MKDIITITLKSQLQLVDDTAPSSNLFLICKLALDLLISFPFNWEEVFSKLRSSLATCSKDTWLEFVRSSILLRKFVEWSPSSEMEIKCISNYTFRNFENVLPKSPPKFLIKLCSQPIKRVKLSLAEEMDQWGWRLELLLSLLSVTGRKLEKFWRRFWYHIFKILQSLIQYTF